MRSVCTRVACSILNWFNWNFKKHVKCTRKAAPLLSFLFMVWENAQVLLLHGHMQAYLVPGTRNRSLVTHLSPRIYTGKCSLRRVEGR